MSIIREVQIGECRLIQGDCRAIDVGADVCLSDPPYGMNIGRRSGSGRSRLTAALDEYDVIGDDAPFMPEQWLGFDEVILWGANHFASRLPDARRWLVWDKREGGTPDDQADCEMAWTNLSGPERLFSHRWRGCIKASERDERRVHPTQKPVAMMEWCLSFTTGATVFDPFMGSGTTGIACVRTGRKFVGIEIDPRHFDTAVRRIEEAYASQALFSGASQ